MADAPNVPAPPSGQQTPPEKPPETANAAPKPAEAPPAPKRYKVGEREVTADEYIESLRAVHGDDGLRDIDNMARITRQKLSKAGATQKEIDAFFADLDDPRRLIHGLARRKFGGDIAKAREYVESGYAADIEERNQPEDKKVESRIEALKREEQELLEAKNAREQAAAAQQYQQDFGKAFVVALKKAGIEEPDGDDIADMAKAVGAEWDECTTAEEQVTLVKDAARKVAQKSLEISAKRLPRLPAEKRSAIVGQYIKEMPPEALMELLGEEGWRKLNGHAVAKAQSRTSSGKFQKQPEAPVATPHTNGKKEKISIDDWITDKVRGGRPL